MLQPKSWSRARSLPQLRNEARAPAVYVYFVPFHFAPLSIVTKQEPQKTKLAMNLKSSTFTRIAQRHHHESLSQFSLCLFLNVATEKLWWSKSSGEKKGAMNQSGQNTFYSAPCDVISYLLIHTGANHQSSVHHSWHAGTGLLRHTARQSGTMLQSNCGYIHSWHIAQGITECFHTRHYPVSFMISDMRNGRARHS